VDTYFIRQQWLNGSQSGDAEELDWRWPMGGDSRQQAFRARVDDATAGARLRRGDARAGGSLTALLGMARDRS
jgi:hypothetical protein